MRLPALVAMGLFLVAGCSTEVKLADVEGTVTLAGKPLDKIHVEFWPEQDGPRSIGMTNDQGRFNLTTDDGKRKGAVVGSHKVVLRDAGVLGDKFLGRAADGVDMSAGRKPRLASEYGDPRRSPLKIEVRSDRRTIDIEVTP